MNEIHSSLTDSDDYDKRSRHPYKMNREENASFYTTKIWTKLFEFFAAFCFLMSRLKTIKQRIVLQKMELVAGVSPRKDAEIRTSEKSYSSRFFTKHYLLDFEILFSNNFHQKNFIDSKKIKIKVSNSFVLFLWNLISRWKRDAQNVCPQICIWKSFLTKWVVFALWFDGAKKK